MGGKYKGIVCKGRVMQDALLQSVYSKLAESSVPHKAYVMSPSEATELSSMTNFGTTDYYDKLFPDRAPDDLVLNISSDSIWGLWGDGLLYGVYDEQLRRDGNGKKDTDKDLHFFPISFVNGQPVFSDVYRLQHHHPGEIIKTEPTSSYVDLSNDYGMVINLESRSTSLSAQYENIASHVDSGLQYISHRINTGKI